MDLTFYQQSNYFAQEVHEVHMVRGPHEPLIQNYWNAGKADLTRGAFSKVGFYDKLRFR
jgi:hypothetical protein